MCADQRRCAEDLGSAAVPPHTTAEGQELDVPAGAAGGKATMSRGASG